MRPFAVSDSPLRYFPKPGGYFSIFEQMQGAAMGGSVHSRAPRQVV